MAIPTYDWNEPEIRHLVERNHVPDERVIVANVDGAVVSQVVCATCGSSPWPCGVLLDLRAWLEENDRKRALMREERGRK